MYYGKVSSYCLHQKVIDKFEEGTFFVNLHCLLLPRMLNSDQADSKLQVSTAFRIYVALAY